MVATASGMGITIAYIAVFGIMIYFMMYRPNKKEKDRIANIMASMAVGDTVLTTSGFYGIIIDITEDDVIVEFGNDKHCRIPMKKTAIMELEKREA